MVKHCKLLFSLVLLVAVVICGCARPPEEPRVEQPAAPEAVQPPAPPAVEPKPDPAIKLPPPTPGEVRNAIARMYKDSVIVDTGRFFVGDFNGDGWQDVAVVVKPAQGMLAELNNEVANWILEDPQKVVLPDPTKTTQQLSPHTEPTRVEQSDMLLAVLHGYGPAGWRDPQARQTYLLKNAVGNNMKAERLAEALQIVPRNASLPKLRGDVISEAIAGEPRLLYYTGAKYAWYRINRADRTVASRR